MVSVIENWAILHGRIDRVSNSDLRDHLVLEVEVDEIDDFEDYPNLLGSLPGTVTEIQLRWTKGDMDRPQPGDTIRCRVRRATPTSIFAHPDDYELITPEPPEPPPLRRLPPSGPNRVV